MHPDLLPILGPLARLRANEADFAGATALGRRSLRIAISACGSNSPTAARAMTALAALYIEEQRYLDAEPLLIAAGNGLTGRFGAEDPAMAPVLVGRAQIALARGERTDARKWAEQAVAIGAGAAPEERSRELRTLGAVLVAEERFDAAEKVLGRALDLARRQIGENGLAAARGLAQLGKAELRQKRFAEALPLIEQAMLIDQSRLGAGHPLIAEDLYNLGLVYGATERLGDARAVLRAAVDLLNRGIGRGTARLAYIELELARVERELGRKEEADFRFADAQRILNAAADAENRRERRI